MKMLIDIADNEAAGFLKLVKSYAKVKIQPLSAPDAAVLDELKHIKKAFKDLDRLKAGKLKTRPAAEFLNEL